MITLNELLYEHYVPLKLRGRSRNTIRLYECTIRSFEKYLGRQAHTDDFTDLVIAKFLISRERDVASHTIEKERSQLCALWRFSFDRRIVGVETRPFLSPAPLPERICRAWSVVELRQLVQCASDQKGKVGRCPANLFWLGLILVAWESAERIGAIMATDRADYERPALLVLAENRKGGKRDKLHTLTPACCDVLDGIPKTKDGKLFYWDQSSTGLWANFGYIVRDAGLGVGRRMKFHQLRRSAASHFKAAGGDAQGLLDHSNPRITRLYLDPRLCEIGKKACDLLPNILDQTTGGGEPE